MDQKLQDKLDKRIKEGTLRSLSSFEDFSDFYSNDYLGFSKIKVENSAIKKYGSTGSRLISGSSIESFEAELFLANHFNSESALIFNSGYDANLGFFSSVPQKGDTVFYDELIHASIRDGIRLSFAKNRSFKHNDLNDLECKLKISESVNYVVVESLYSMDGDISPLIDLANLCVKYNAFLIVDEAHSSGVFGENGTGLVSELGLESFVFARVVTFGKAYGSHGACILCKENLKKYLINFSRSFIYTTALPPETFARIKYIVNHSEIDQRRIKLKEVIAYFRNSIRNIKSISDNNSPIQLIRIGDVGKTKLISIMLQKNKIAVKPIFSPTVPLGNEGLRICLHSFNTKTEIDLLVYELNKLEF